jgi:hypothetical protein
MQAECRDYTDISTVKFLISTTPLVINVPPLINAPLLINAPKNLLISAELMSKSMIY